MTPSVVIVLLVGQRITPLVSPWLTMTRSESKPAERGRFVMRLQEICWKGQVVVEQMGVRGGRVGYLLDLFCWQIAQSSTYFHTKDVRSGHQNLEVTS